MTSKETHDPGWNDPPLFTYDKATAIQAAAANKKGILLNKRVAFPISGSTQGSNQTNLSSTDLSKPPLMSQPPLSSPPLNVCNKLETCTLPVKVEPATKNKIDEVLRNLQVKNICDDEIVKRIKIMEKMWLEDKLDENVRLKIIELSEALVKDDVEMADHIQKGLMVDYVSQCSTWMSGIRYLINQKKK